MDPARRRVADISLPYYEAIFQESGEARTLYVEAFLTPRLRPLYRVSLIMPRPDKLRGTPLPGTIRLPASDRDTLTGSLLEGIRAILASDQLDKPSFEFEGLRGIIRAILTGGRYKAVRGTRALEYKTAYMYLTEVLGITEEPRITFGALKWRPLRVYYEPGPQGLVPVRFEDLAEGVPAPERLLLMLAKRDPGAFQGLLDYVDRYSL